MNKIQAQSQLYIIIILILFFCHNSHNNQFITNIKETSGI